MGLKGSDGAEVLRAALERGAARDAPRRARLALERLARVREHVEVVTWPGEMGEDEARAAGWEPRVVGSLSGRSLLRALRAGAERRAPGDRLRGLRPHHAGGHGAGGARPGRRRRGPYPLRRRRRHGTQHLQRRRGPRTGHRRARRRQDPLGGVRHHAGRRRRRGGALPARAPRRRPTARERGHGHRRGGVPREPRLRPSLRVHDRAVRPRTHAERQGRRSGRRGAGAERHRHRGHRRHGARGAVRPGPRAPPRAP